MTGLSHGAESTSELTESAEAAARRFARENIALRQQLNDERLRSHGLKMTVVTLVLAFIAELAWQVLA